MNKSKPTLTLEQKIARYYAYKAKVDKYSKKAEKLRKSIAEQLSDFMPKTYYPIYPSYPNVVTLPYKSPFYCDGSSATLTCTGASNGVVMAASPVETMKAICTSGLSQVKA